jgi:hypothetical protein
MDATNSAQSIDMWQQHSTTQHGMARSAQAQAQAQARHTTADRTAGTAHWDVLLGSSVADVNWQKTPRQTCDSCCAVDVVLITPILRPVATRYERGVWGDCGGFREFDPAQPQCNMTAPTASPTRRLGLLWPIGALKCAKVPLAVCCCT